MGFRVQGSGVRVKGLGQALRPNPQESESYTPPWEAAEEQPQAQAQARSRARALARIFPCRHAESLATLGGLGFGCWVGGTLLQLSRFIRLGLL